MTPYVIVGMPRTGSTLLATGLGQHPEISCFGELFHPVANERQFAHNLTVDGSSVSFVPDRDDAIEFVKNYVFGLGGNDQVKASGFKLFGDYVKGPGSERLFARLKEEIPDLRVIHIKRGNYLDVLVSREMAKQTNQWVVMTDDSPAMIRQTSKSRPMLTIPVDMAERLFDAMTQVDGFYERFFGGENYRRIDYSALECDFSKKMNSLYDFLGAHPFEPTEQTVKMRSSKPYSLVVNMGELKKHFSNTRHRSFFLELP